jgi:hypothetical protein
MKTLRMMSLPRITDETEVSLTGLTNFIHIRASLVEIEVALGLDDDQSRALRGDLHNIGFHRIGTKGARVVLIAPPEITTFYRRAVA